MIGETVGNFQIIQQLGRGGMGEVWLAEHHEIKTKVAIKMLLPHISDDRSHVQRFFNEAVAVSKIKHSGIAKIFDVGYHGKQAYLVMEFLEGEPLASRLRRVGQFKLAELADVGRQIAGVLEATHAEGITHRDLKPDNIFVVRDAEMVSGERVKILDFGIAKLGNTGLTGTGQGSMGTPAYMSPEQWKQAGKVDHRADIYSLGCLAFELASGRPPFVASSIGEACGMHLNEPAPSVRSFAPSLPLSLEQLFARMLAKDPDHRPSMAEIKAGFAAAETAGVMTDTLPAPRMMRPVTRDADTATTLGGSAGSAAVSIPPKRSKLPLILVGAGVAVAGVITVVVVTREPKSQEPVAMPAPPTPEPRPPAAAVVVPPPPILNKWVKIEPPPTPYELGVTTPKPTDELLGFRPGRGVMTPKSGYSIQAHEVTWEELEDWLAKNPTMAPAAPISWATEPKTRAKLPASGLTWSAAVAYCGTIGGRLPSEEEWEYAARGADHRPNPWGTEPIDLIVNRVYAKPDTSPAPVESIAQDVTPNGIHDLAGNVQEWTSALWRADNKGEDESWVQDAATKTTFRAIRGLPLVEPPPKKTPREIAAFRQPLCSTGVCVEKSQKRLARVGFRCARNE